MGHNINSYGELDYNDDATNPGPLGDFQAASDMTRRLGNTRSDTMTVRLAMTAANVRAGQLFSETDTGNLWRWSGSAWQLVWSPVFAHAGKVAGFQNMAGGQVATLGLQEAEGGFTLVDNALVVPQSGRYELNARMYYSGAGGGSVIGVIQKNGAALSEMRDFKDSGQDATANTTLTVRLVQGDTLRLYTTYAGATWGTTGYDGTFLEARRVA